MVEPGAGGLLEGVRVLDFALWRPGPYATQLLAEAGADVIKVEPPGGDPMRVYASLFTSLHAGKRSVALDLKDAANRDYVVELLTTADVVIEGYRPGVAARLGLGYDDARRANPSVVYCSLSGFGQDGPLAFVPGHDVNYLAWAGALAPDGGEPVMPRVPVADLAGGLAAAFAICAALVRRSATGEGEYIDVAMADVLATWTGAAEPAADGVDAQARQVPGYGLFATEDGGFVSLGVLTEDHFWVPLCDVLGIDDARSLSFASRMRVCAALQTRIAGAIALRDRATLVADLLAAGVPVAPVLDRAGMLGLDHFVSRGVSTSFPWASRATGHAARYRHHAVGSSGPPPPLDAVHRPRFREYHSSG